MVHASLFKNEMKVKSGGETHSWRGAENILEQFLFSLPQFFGNTKQDYKYETNFHTMFYVVFFETKRTKKIMWGNVQMKSMYTNMHSWDRKMKPQNHWRERTLLEMIGSTLGTDLFNESQGSMHTK